MNVYKEIRESNFTEKQKLRLENLYEKYLTTQNKSELKAEAEKILSELFQNPCEFSIPMKFLNTDIGKILLRLKLEVDEESIFSVSDVAILSGTTRSNIHKALNSGKLKSEKISSRYTICEDNVIEYLKNELKVPMSEQTAKNRITLLKKLKNENKSIEEIKEKFEKEIKKNG